MHAILEVGVAISVVTLILILRDRAIGVFEGERGREEREEERETGGGGGRDF